MGILRQNDIEGSTELWLDGEFQAAWPLVNIPSDAKAVLENIILHAVEHGKRAKAKEIRQVIGA